MRGQALDDKDDSIILHLSNRLKGTLQKDRMRSLYQAFVGVFFCVAAISPCAAFVTQPSHQLNQPTQRQSPPLLSVVILKAKEDEKVEVGSKEYLEGFFSSPIQDESVAERGSGLEQALKLGGSFTVGLAVLFLGFMASNGLL